MFHDDVDGFIGFEIVYNFDDVGMFDASHDFYFSHY